MSRLFGGGLVFDIVLAVIAAEFAVLIAYRLWHGRQLVAVDVYANLAAAAGLLGAIHASIAAAWWQTPTSNRRKA